MDRGAALLQGAGTKEMPATDQDAIWSKGRNTDLPPSPLVLPTLVELKQKGKRAWDILCNGNAEKGEKKENNDPESKPTSEHNLCPR